MGKKAVVCVMSDFVTDQRVIKTTDFLLKKGYEVTVYCLQGKGIPAEIPVTLKPVKVWRNKGMLFFLSFNFNVLLKLLFTNAHLYWANDLDTLLPVYLAGKLKRKKIVYDSHELYTEQPSLHRKKTKKKIWETVERWCIPGVDRFITVNGSIADWYREKYGKEVGVVMNMPLLSVTQPIVPVTEFYPGRKTLILQGSGIHKGRGGPEIVAAMAHLDATYLLVVIGSGDALPLMKALVKENASEEKVVFLPRMPYREMMAYTKASALGLHLDAPDGSLNSLYSSPNKLFDYIHAGIPVLAAPGVEIRKVLDTWNVGFYLEQVEPVSLARSIKEVFSNHNLMMERRANTNKAAPELCWERQLVELERILTDV